MKRTIYFLIIMAALSIPATRALMAQSTGEVVNLGLYGGRALDLTYCNTNNRLFGAVETPGSVFFTDDHGATWTRPFPLDSMEYASGQRGWGGGGRKIFTNSKGWVAVRTAQSGGTLTSSVISFDEGDVNTFATAIDRVMLHNINPAYNAMSVTGIGLSDHYMYIGLQKYLVRHNDTSTYSSYNVVAQTDTIPGIGADYIIRDMAVANHPSGYPVYMVLSSSSLSGGKIYKFDGVRFTAVPLTSVHSFPHTIDAVFTHPAHYEGDTIIASLRDTFSSNIFVFLSTDGGASWANITPSSGSNWPLHSADYSPSWVASMPVSEGLRLSFPGGGVSDDLGASWSAHVLPDNAMATYPTDLSRVCGSYGRGVAFSTSGAGGPFTIAANDGFAAIGITKIAQSSGIYYVSTNGGLGYTEAYFDPSVVGADKWRAPYGAFPIAGVGDDGGVTAVTVSPSDPLHVIAGHSNGFSVTTTGNAGFSQVTPAGWNADNDHMDIRVMDVKFITDQLAIAVTGTGSNVLPNILWDYGNIWRTTDGGASWSIVTPTSLMPPLEFQQGTAVEFGVAGGDTVIYATGGYWDMAYSKVDGQLWKSEDLGLTWSYVNSGPTGVMSGTTNMTIYDIDVDPRNNDLIYLASGENLDYALARSTNGGSSYSNLPVMPHGAFSSVLVNRANPDVVYAGARRNVFRYNNATGITLTCFTGMPGEFVPDLENGSTLLGTSTGFYKLVEDFGGTSTTMTNDGNWSNPANWTNGQPEYLTNVEITASQSNVDDQFEMNAVALHPGSALTLEAAGFMSLNDTMLIHADATGSGSFINERDAVSFQADVEVYLTDGRWHYISPVVEGATAGDFYFPGSSSSWIKQYDEPSNTWQYINDLGHVLETGRGYAVWIATGKSAETTVYRGVMHNNDILKSLEYSSPTGGWNMIGNPYPCALDWDAGDFQLTNTSGIAYVYSNGNYLSRNTIGGGTLTDGIIPSGQGFFVQATAASASVTLNRAARVHAVQSFYKSKDVVSEALDLTIEGNGLQDKTWIGFHSNATPLADNGIDAIRLEGSADAPKLYTHIGEQKMSINMLPLFEDDAEIMLYLKVAQAGTYTFNVGFVESFQNTLITLTDLQTGLMIVLNNQQQYIFDAQPNDETERFVLRFEKNAVQLPVFQRVDSMRIATGDDVLYVDWNAESENKAELKVFSLDGRILKRLEVSAGVSYTISIPTAQSSMLLVMLNSENGIQVVKCIIH